MHTHRTHAHITSCNARPHLTTLADPQPLVTKEPNRLELKAPYTVVGDIHGQYFDLMNMFEINGDPPSSRYLFLGDYVDRGKFSCEVMLYLLALKLTYPKQIYLLRGNHECASVSAHFGFKDECKGKYGRALYNRFVLCFQSLPIAASITTPHGELLAVHGGISPEIETLRCDVCFVLCEQCAR